MQSLWAFFVAINVHMHHMPMLNKSKYVDRRIGEKIS